MRRSQSRDPQPPGRGESSRSFFFFRRRASTSRPEPEETQRERERDEVEQPQRERRRWWQRRRRDRVASDDTSNSSPLQRRSLSPPGFSANDTASYTSAPSRPLHAPPAARRVSAASGGGLGEVSRERRRSRLRTSASSASRSESLPFDIASLLNSNGGQGESSSIQVNSNNNGDMTFVANIDMSSMGSASAGEDFRRLRDEFLEAIAMAVLDQHEIETAENELKRLEHELEVGQLRQALKEIEITYDASREKAEAGENAGTEEEMRETESKAAIARLLLKASISSQKLLLLRAQQQQLSEEALRLELDLNLTMATVSNLRQNPSIMEEMIEEERRLSDERRDSPSTEELNGIPVEDQIMCQKFHIACLRARASGKLKISLRRDRMYADSKLLLEQLPAMQLRKRLAVAFSGEEGRDFGGMAREWFQCLGADLLRIGLEEGCLDFANEDCSRVKIAAMKYVSTKAMGYYHLLGRAAGMALFHNKTLNFPFAKVLLQLVLGEPPRLEMLKELDQDLYRNLSYMLENPGAEELDLTFTTEERDEYGTVAIVDLALGGAAMAVNDRNKADYVQRLLQRRFQHDTEKQCRTIREALCEVLPSRVFSLLDINQLYLLIVGNAHLSVNEWRQYTHYEAYEESSDVVQWFWDVVCDYSDEKRAKLLHFTTGASRLPVQGFAGLQGTHGTAPFTLSRNGVPESLPVGHTCSNRLDLPPYPSKEVLRAKLDYAIAETEGFGIV